jgi:hypothetical protein
MRRDGARKSHGRYRRLSSRLFVDFEGVRTRFADCDMVVILVRAGDSKARDSSLFYARCVATWTRLLQAGSDLWEALVVPHFRSGKGRDHRLATSEETQVCPFPDQRGFDHLKIRMQSR